MSKGLNTPGPRKGPDKDSSPMTATVINTDLQNPTETYQLCTPLRLKTLKLDELSEELDKCTKETQMLQEEIENATKEAFQKVCCINSLKPRLNRDTVSVDSDIGSSRDQDPSQPAAYGLDVWSLEAVRQVFTFPGKEVLESTVEDYCQQVSELQRQINESHDHHEEQKFHFRQTIIQLQTELHQVNMEKDFLSDLRMKESRRHAGEMERVQAALCDLQTTQRSGEKKLRQVEEEARVLSRKAESLEGTARQVYCTLMAHHRGGSTGLPAPGSPGQLMPVGRLTVEVLEDLEQESDQLREGLSQVLEKLKSEELNHQANAEVMLKEQQDRMEQLIAGHDQQVAMLTEKLNSNATLLLKFERLQKYTESQETFHNCQVKELDSVLSIHKDRVRALEQQLQSQADETQRERERSLKQAAELQSQLGQLTEELRQAKEEQGGEKEHGRLLQQRSTELQAAVEDLSKDLEERSVLAHHLHSLLGTVKQDCLAQMEALRSREQQRRWELQEEVRSLREQLGATREEAEGRRSQTLLPQGDEEHTQREAQQASVAEQGRGVQELTLEREQLSAQLDHQRTQMFSLTEDQEEQRRLRSAETEEQQEVVQQLRDQLRSTQEDLQEARSALRTLEDADGHGLKVARGIQRQMTARRQHVDALQSRIQQLEETMETLHQEKRSQSRELASVREQKRQLAVELEALCSRETQHQEKVRELEAALYKMSESFADCRALLQFQEQESVRLKLQHALDLKATRLQGHNLRSAAAVSAPLCIPPPTLASSLPSAPAAQHPSWHGTPDIKSPGLQDSAAWERPPLARETRGGRHGMMSEKPRPQVPHHRRHPPRRRSAPEWGCGTTLELLGRSDLQEDSTDSPVSCENLGGSRSSTPTSYTPSPPPAVCRSPVHSLLTSDPRNKAASDRLEAAAAHTSKPREISSVIRGYANKTSPE